MRAFEALGRLGFTGAVPGGAPGPVGHPGQDVDCRLGQDWRSLLAPRRLHDVWAPPPASPWSGYHRPTLFASLGKAAAGQVNPIPWAPLDTASALRSKPRLPPSTAVVLDLPGAWSVAVAAWMALTAGFQPVVLANNWPHPKGIVPLQGMLGALLYYAPWVGQDADLRGAAAPPVFVLDRNRLGRQPQVHDFDNRYFPLESDLPSATSLRRAGILRVLYVHPPGGTPDAAGHPDMDDLNAWLREVRKSLGLVQASEMAPGEWALRPAQDFAPAPRKTVFNTVKDPAFAGFRRAAAGGFGRIIPEPSSGGHAGAGFG